eukprot:GEMP01095229.1.p1 GENE.GEMP01095229.1~~GEMP01095229.1.p1  ORF type:complete len:197 (+),score=44.49 GEMP01095229.1:124-714(+)
MQPFEAEIRLLSASHYIKEAEDARIRMEPAAKEMGLTSAFFKSVPPRYYDQSLEWRRRLLDANGIECLCKSIVMENTHADEPQYVLVIVQYISKLHKDKLNEAMWLLDGKKRNKKTGYNLRVVAEEKSDELTGFTHNSVSIVGLKIPLQMIVSDQVVAQSQFWLGGGHADVKLRLDARQFLVKMQPFVADITSARE